MRQPLLLLVAHGSPRHPAALTPLAAHAAALATGGEWGEVRLAVLNGQPALEPVLADWAGEQQVVVVPLFMAEGAFTRRHLPSRLDIDQRPTWRIAAPLGTAPALEQVVYERWLGVLGHAPIGSVGLLLVAHGSATVPGAQRSALDVVARLGQRGVPAAAAFVEAEPHIPAALTALTTPRVLVLPWMIADAGHLQVDVREALSTIGNTVDITLDPAIGGAPAMRPVITTLAREALERAG